MVILLIFLYIRGMRRTVLAVILTVMPFIATSASDYVVEIEPSKKIIFMDNLNLPPDTNLESLLRLLPELMNRGDVLFQNYDLHVDGKSVGESRDVFVCQMRVCDIEKIEVTTSSVATQSREGQSGTVNVVPKTPVEGFGGTLNLDASTEFDVMPSVNLRYKKNDFQMLGYANLEYYGPETYKITSERTKTYSMVTDNTTRQKYFQQTARLNLKYKFKEKNTIKAWLLESYGNERTDVFRECEKFDSGAGTYGPDWFYRTMEKDTVANTNNSILLNLMAEYERKTVGDGKFIAFFGYEHSHNSNGKSNTLPNILNGELKYEQTVLKTDVQSLKMKGGVNYSGTNKIVSDATSKSLYLSPYFDFNYHFKGLWVNGTARYQYFNRSFTVREDSDFGKKERDFVGNLNALWQICPHHAVKFTASKNLIRPDDTMLYPGYTYYPATNTLILGDKDLERSSVYELDLSYITDLHWGPHSLTLNAGVGYDRADKLIEAHNGQLRMGLLRPDQKEVPIPYVYYENSGVKDIAKMNVSAIYKYDLLTVSFAGNLFYNFSQMKNNSRESLYYNLSSSAIVNLPKNWNISGNLQYNSSIMRNNALLGDRLLASAKVYKSFGRVSLSLELFDMFDCSTEDVEIDGPKTITTMYDLYGRYVNLGVRYKFGVGR